MPTARQHVVRTAQAFSALIVSWFATSLVLTVPYRFLHEISGAPAGLRAPFFIALSLVVAIVAARLLWLRLDVRRQAFEARRTQDVAPDAERATATPSSDAASVRSWAAANTDRTRAGP